MEYLDKFLIISSHAFAWYQLFREYHKNKNDNNKKDV